MIPYDEIPTETIASLSLAGEIDITYEIKDKNQDGNRNSRNFIEILIERSINMNHLDRILIFIIGVYCRVKLAFWMNISTSICFLVQIWR